MLSFHVVLQAFDAGEGRSTEGAVNLLSELLRYMFGHVSRQITFQERAEFAEVTEVPFQLIVDLVDVSLQLVFVVGISAQAAKSSFVVLLRITRFVANSLKLRRRELVSFVEMIFVNDFIVVQILFREARVNDVFDLGFHFNIHTSGRIFAKFMLNGHGDVL